MHMEASFCARILLIALRYSRCSHNCTDPTCCRRFGRLCLEQCVFIVFYHVIPNDQSKKGASKLLLFGDIVFRRYGHARESRIVASSLMPFQTTH